QVLGAQEQGLGVFPATFDQAHRWASRQSRKKLLRTRRIKHRSAVECQHPVSILRLSAHRPRWRAPRARGEVRASLRAVRTPRPRGNEILFVPCKGAGAVGGSLEHPGGMARALNLVGAFIVSRDARVGVSAPQGIPRAVPETAMNLHGLVRNTRG